MLCWGFEAIGRYLFAVQCPVDSDPFVAHLLNSRVVMLQAEERGCSGTEIP